MYRRKPTLHESEICLLAAYSAYIKKIDLYLCSTWSTTNKQSVKDDDCDTNNHCDGDTNNHDDNDVWNYRQNQEAQETCEP